MIGLRLYTHEKKSVVMKLSVIVLKTSKKKETNFNSYFLSSSLLSYIHTAYWVYGIIFTHQKLKKFDMSYDLCDRLSRLLQKKSFCILIILSPPSNVFFFQLLLISWMVTLSSCLIWQIISFILSPHEYGCVYAWTTLGNIATLLWKSWYCSRMCMKISYGFCKKGSTVSCVCSLSCEKSERNWHPHR